MYRVAVIKGDGIGPEVVDSAIRVVNSVTDRIRFYEFEGGFEVFKRIGSPISEDDLKEIRKMDAILFGATTTPFNVPGYRSLIVTLRKELDLYANLRIIPDLSNGKEIVIVRENTEGLYARDGIGFSDRAIDFRIITLEGARRIAKFAINLAKERNSFITFVHKANVLKGDRFFREIVLEIAEREGVEVREAIIDSFMIKLVKNPWDHGVILTENMFGDIISDLATIHAGSIGIVPSGNYGDEIALFEPIHGSAPDIAGKGIANPIGAILSAAMMLDYLGLNGKVVWEATRRYVRYGNLTPDMGGTATTSEVTKGIISEIYSFDPFDIDEIWVEEIRLGRIPLTLWR
ncbi:isocitrate--homoisocitrate dehydrogenase [Pyrococcus abyssi]|uniref:3-isopropylmalate dehydrogenase n=1 Tax=Pyrococcus abyssi (strain GE5 / Orsay) TaxID=272844 RepID=Q9V1I8_PYRAB|nr:isocitrate--homoisocitrate dehydrogenase [Pyrococcus abyssi]CAB49361.1 leuB-2 3-isopropylmalate dehydrogenase [Pyrococcus abyssi GE5]CCE69820.1 TPA: 3-isopropylmalate dehydrogenase [Pyrococcus abyssi GE5]